MKAKGMIPFSDSHRRYAMSEAWYYLGGAFLCLTGWVVGWRLLSRKRVSHGHSACAFCGYFTTGLPTSICPECGKDLNVVGIRRPTRWREFSPGARLGFTLLSFTAAFWTAAGLVWIPFNAHLQPGTYLFSDVVCLTASKRQQTVQISRAASAYCRPWERNAMLARIAPPSAWVVEILETGSMSGPDPAEILEARMAHFIVLPEKFRYRSLHELPSEVQRSFRTETADRFWVDCASDRYGWGDSEAGDFFFRSGPHEDDFSLWLAKQANRLETPQLEARVRGAVPIALSAPFLAGKSMAYTGCSVIGSGSGYDWIPDRRWTARFWLAAIALYAMSAFALARQSVWYRAREKKRPAIASQGRS